MYIKNRFSVARLHCMYLLTFCEPFERVASLAAACSPHPSMMILIILCSRFQSIAALLLHQARSSSHVCTSFGMNLLSRPALPAIVIRIMCRFYLQRLMSVIQCSPTQHDV